jgi:hypothetical protein
MSSLRQSGLMHCSNFRLYSITAPAIASSAAMACLELLVESVLDEVIQHPVGLSRGGGIKLRSVFHHGFFLSKGIQPTASTAHSHSC